MNRLQLDDVHFGALRGVNCAFEPGVHWVLGNEPDAAAHLIDLACGLARPRRGRVQLAEQAVWSSALLRSRVGALPARAQLPRMLVGQLLHHVLSLQGTQDDPASLLARWESSSWLGLPTHALDPTRARALLLMVALANAPHKKLLALYEPFLVGLAPERVRQGIEQAAQAGAVVLIAAPGTSIDEARSLPATSLRSLQHGLVLDADERAHQAAPLEGATLAAGAARVFVSCADARPLAQTLSLDPRVVALRLSQSTGMGLLEVSGNDALALAAAVGDAALQTQTPIAHLNSESTLGSRP